MTRSLNIFMKVCDVVTNLNHHQRDRKNLFKVLSLFVRIFFSFVQQCLMD